MLKAYLLTVPRSENSAEFSLPLTHVNARLSSFFTFKMEADTIAESLSVDLQEVLILLLFNYSLILVRL
jgi:hypothetical protein